MRSLLDVVNKILLIKCYPFDLKKVPIQRSSFMKMNFANSGS